jgi:hypothetical protein
MGTAVQVNSLFSLAVCCNNTGLLCMRLSVHPGDVSFVSFVSLPRTYFPLSNSWRLKECQSAKGYSEEGVWRGKKAIITIAPKNQSF